jgi:colanic acid/amylovoran biosynthesis glycosyltransferase
LVITSQNNGSFTSSGSGLRVAYLVLRFPSLSETFVAREIAALRSMGWDIPIYPLWKEDPATIHDLVRPLLPAVRWTHPLSRTVALANLHMLRRQPKRYIATLGFVASDIARSPIRGLKALALFPLMVWSAASMQSDGIDHVHAHFASYPALAALVSHRLTGVSYSFTAHAYDLYVSPLRLSQKVASSSFVITISEFNRQLVLEAAGHAAPVHVIHCGVDVPSELPSPSGVDNHIVSVARLEEKKGLRFLIDACAELRDRGVSHTCTIIGSGPMEGALRRQIDEHGLSDVVRLAGAMTTEGVQRELQRATVFALPSIVTRNGNADGIPVAIMEAMAAGVPVVSTRVTGIPELIEHGVNGLLVDPRNALALTDALQKMLSDDALRNAFRRAGYERIANDFCLDKCAREVANTIAETVCSRIY